MNRGCSESSIRNGPRELQCGEETRITSGRYARSTFIDSSIRTVSAPPGPRNSGTLRFGAFGAITPQTTPDPEAGRSTWTTTERGGFVV